MQTGTEQLKRQQLLLKLKGFYSGAIDGIWSTMTIAAKQKWERTRGFVPALPNNGMPFASKGPYPSGVRTGLDGLLTCAEVEEFLESRKTAPKVQPTKEEKKLADVVPATAAAAATEE